MRARHSFGFPMILMVSLVLVGLVGRAGCADPDGGGPVAPYPAPDFSLPDFNPYSSSWNDHRSPSEEVGKVLVVYFASFS